MSIYSYTCVCGDRCGSVLISVGCASAGSCKGRGLFARVNALIVNQSSQFLRLPVQFNISLAEIESIFQ